MGFIFFGLPVRLSIMRFIDEVWEFFIIQMCSYFIVNHTYASDSRTLTFDWLIFGFLPFFRWEVHPAAVLHQGPSGVGYQGRGPVPETFFLGEDLNTIRSLAHPPSPPPPLPCCLSCDRWVCFQSPPSLGHPTNSFPLALVLEMLIVVDLGKVFHGWVGPLL